MTDEQIVKALEQCGIYEFDDKQESCKECPFCGCDYCKYELCDFALDLIKRQQAEIEGLKADKEAIINGQLTLQKMYFESRAEAVREFAERLKKRLDRKYTIYGREYVLRHMRELVKETTEKEGGKG